VEIGYLIAALAGFFIGAAMLFGFMQSKLRHAAEKLELVTTHHTRELGRQKEAGLTLVTYPYKEDHAKNGMWDERRIEVGYKYQLFVNGAPCFQPHVVITDVLTKKDLNGERIDYAFSRATDTVLKLAELNPSIKALTTTSEISAVVQKSLAQISVQSP